MACVPGIMSSTPLHIAVQNSSFTPNCLVSNSCVAFTRQAGHRLPQQPSPLVWHSSHSRRPAITAAASEEGDRPTSSSSGSDASPKAPQPPSSLPSSSQQVEEPEERDLLIPILVIISLIGYCAIAVVSWVQYNFDF